MGYVFIIVAGIVTMYGSVTKNYWLLQGRGYFENKYNLAEKLWFRVVIFINGLLIFGIGIYALGDFLDIWNQF